MAFRIIVADVGALLPGARRAARPLPGACPSASRTTSRCPSRTAIARCTPASSGPSGQRIEIQIRTAEMHEIAERGVAAHWRYKQGGPSTDAPQYRWLRELIDILEQAPNAGGVPRAHQARDVPGPGVLLHAQGQADRAAARRHADRLRLCGAHRGRRHLRRRQDQRPHACRCSTQLANGDQVEIVTSKAQTPSPTWERFVVTGKAQGRASAASSARSSASSTSSSAARCSTRPSARRATRSPTRRSTACCTNFKQATVDDLVAAVGDGSDRPREVLTAVYPGRSSSRAGERRPTSCRSRARATRRPARRRQAAAADRRSAA